VITERWGIANQGHDTGNFSPVRKVRSCREERRSAVLSQPQWAKKKEWSHEYGAAGLQRTTSIVSEKAKSRLAAGEKKPNLALKKNSVT